MMSLIVLFYSYIVIAFLVFGYFFGVFLADQSTPNTHRGSWGALGLATLFWPIVLPLAYLERRVTKPTEVTKVDDDLRLEETDHSSSKSSSPHQDVRRSA